MTAVTSQPEAKTPPVIFLVFNRPEHTRESLAAIRRARPARLLVVADGPRADVLTDASACAEVRRIIQDGIDWPTEASFNFADANMGLRPRVSSGLTWAFEQVESAVIIEDDCLVEESFFRFCSEMLEKYRDDERVGCVNGCSLLPPGFALDTSYCFTKWPNPWGWATWRRAWRFYDAPMRLFARALADGSFAAWFPHLRNRLFWERRMERMYEGRQSSWAYIWWLTCWSNSMLAINPVVNLVRNTGFGEGSTHTPDPDDWMARLSVGEMSFPLRHPECVAPLPAADHFFCNARGHAGFRRVWEARLHSWFQKDRPPRPAALRKPRAT